MRKIPTLFLRDEKTHQLTPEVNPEAAWVIAGEGVATRKFDGMTLLIQNQAAYKRVTVKKDNLPPSNWVPAQNAPDPVTGEWPGWVPISADSKEDQYFREALGSSLGTPRSEGTYELIGPKINGNPEGVAEHQLVLHGMDRPSLPVPRNFEGLKAFFEVQPIEGIVWHHPDGRMVKVKGKDFGLKRATVAQEVRA